MKGFFFSLSLHEGEKNVSGIKDGFVSCLFVSYSLCLFLPAYKSFWNSESKVKQYVCELDIVLIV